MSIRKKHQDSIFAITIILGLALLIRIIYLYLYQQMPDWNLLTVDNYYHHNWAQTIMDGNIFGDTTYFRAPFYIYCLAFLYKLFGISLWVGRIFGVLIGISSVFFTYLIGTKIFDKKIGLTAAFIHAIYPIIIYFESELLLDPLFMLLLQISIYQFIIWVDTKSNRNGFLTGLFIGLASITRPTSLVIIPLLIIFYLYRNGFKKYSSLLLYLSGILLIIGFTFFRNLSVANDPVFIASQGGINFYIGNNEIADGLSAKLPEPLGNNWRINAITNKAELEMDKDLLPGEVSSFWFQQGLTWIINNPYNALKLYIKKILFYISNQETSNNRDLKYFFNKHPLLNIYTIPFGVLFIFFCIGLFISPKPVYSNYLLILIIFLIYISSLFFYTSRFRLPLLPFFIIIASYGFWNIINHIKTKQYLVKNLIVIIVSALITFNVYSERGTENAPMSLNRKGLFEYYSGNYDASIKIFHKALSQNGSSPDINLNLGASFLKMSKVDSAEYYFKQEIEYNPKRHKAYINLSSIYFLRKDYPKALKYAQEAVDLAPYDINANKILLRTLARIDSADHAALKDRLKISLENTENNIHLLYDAGLVLTETSEFQLAENILNKAKAASPPDVETDDELFEQKYINSFNNIEKLKAKIYYQLGYLNGIRKDYFSGIKNSKKAIDLDSLIVEAYINLASCYFSIGNNRLADSIYTEIKNRFPNNIYLK